MAIYGDGKHNENMEYNTPKFEVTDKTIYYNIYFTIESDDGKEYIVRLVENDVFDEWKIMDEDGNDIDYNADLYNELIMLCEASLNK
jgi:hypothetical protein